MSFLQPAISFVRPVPESHPAPARHLSLLERMARGAVGYRVERSMVPLDAIEEALRQLNLEIRRRGLTPEEIRSCAESTFFPHLRWEPWVDLLRAPLDDALRPGPADGWADPQLLMRFPDEPATWPLTGHVDKLPPWATDRSYRVIAGVALTRARRRDGCLAVWPGSHLGVKREPAFVEVDPGDVVLMHPKLEHCSTLNKGATIRTAVYFRLLGTGR